MIRFADGIAIFTGNEQDLHEILSGMDRVLREEFSIGLNKQKKTIVVCSKRQLNRTHITNNSERNYSGSRGN